MLFCFVLIFIFNLTLFICDCGLSNGLQDGPQYFSLLWYCHYVILMSFILFVDNLSARMMSITFSECYLFYCFSLLDVDNSYCIITFNSMTGRVPLTGELIDLIGLMLL